jgi:hypothetical protein
MRQGKVPWYTQVPWYLYHGKVGVPTMVPWYSGTGTCTMVAEWLRQLSKQVNLLTICSMPLKHFLHQINKHPTGLCQSCTMPETIKHFLLECQNPLAIKLRQWATDGNIQLPSVAEVLTNDCTLRLIEQYCKETVWHS